MSSSPSVAAGRGRLPVRTRDRRAALSALALLLVVLGALGSALVVYRSGHRTDVLVAARDILPGTKVQASDFTTARVANDSGAVVDAANEKNFVGTYATTEIPSGTLLNRLMFQSSSIVPDDGVVVGVTLTRSQRPATPVATGDVVRAYQVSKTSASDGTSDSPVLVQAARVVSVSAGSSSSDTVTVSLLVDQAVAPTLVAAAGQGTVSVGALPMDATPSIDFQKGS